MEPNVEPTRAAPGRRSRRARWIRLAALAAGAVLLLALVLPWALAPLVRGRIEDEIEKRFPVRASIGHFSFSWLGNARVADVEIDELDGAPLASLGEARASVGLLGLLAGSVAAEVDVRGFEVHARKDAAGRWNLARVVGESTADEDEAREPEEDRELPDVHVQLTVSDGRVIVHGEEGDTELGHIALVATVDGLDRPAPYRVSLDLRGPAGEAGGLALEGTLTAASEGVLGIDGLQGTADLELRDLRLAALAPAIAEVAPVRGLEGALQGKASLDLGRGLALNGNGAITLRDLAFSGPRASAAPIRVQEIALRGTATQAPSGAGTQELALSADDFLRLDYAGTSSLAAEDGNGEGELGGVLTLEGGLARLAEFARGWIPLQEGVALEGRLTQRAEIAAKLRARTPSSLRIAARGGIDGLAARSAEGRPIDLGALTRIGLELEVSADLERDEITLPRLAVDAGAIRLNAHASARADGTQDAAFELDADLGRLRADLAQIVDLGDAALGGTLQARGSLQGDGGATALDGRVEARALAFGDLALASADGTLRGRREESEALELEATLHVTEIALLSAGTDPLRIPALDATIAASQDAARRGKANLQLTTGDAGLVLALQADTDLPATGEQRATGEITVRGEVATLADVLRPRLGLAAGLAGALDCRAAFDARLHELELATLDAQAVLEIGALSRADARGERHGLGTLERVHATLDSAFDAGRGALDLRSFALDAGPLRAAGSGKVAGIAGPAGAARDPRALEIADARFVLDADLAELGRSLPGLVGLGGVELSGDPLHAEVAVTTRDARIEAEGALNVAQFVIKRPTEAPITQKDLALAFQVGYEPAAGSLECRKFELASQTLTASARGTVTDLAHVERARADLELTFGGELARILGDLGLERADAGRATRGRVGGTLEIGGDRGALHLTGETAIQDFELTITRPAEKEGEARTLVIAEPRIELAYDALVDVERLDVEIASATLESEMARGGLKGRIANLRALGAADPAEPVTFDGLRGELAYVPDRVGAVLAPWLPGELSGAEEERITFELDGVASDTGLASLLERATAQARVGLGRFKRPEVELAGELALDVQEGRTRIDGELRANGGTLELRTDLDLAPSGDGATRSTLGVHAVDCGANSGLAPLFALIHPAFAGIELTQGRIEGRFDLALDVAYDGPLTLEQLESGWSALPKQPISGKGRFELRGATLLGSPLMALLEDFGIDTSRSVDLKPIEFAIERGRLSYTQPWTWTLSGVETTFSGSIGLDQSLDLAWNVPVTGKLVERYSFLSILEGSVIRVPLHGTVKKPKLELESLLTDLASQAAKQELGSRLGLGGGGEKNDHANDPTALLKEADRLWDEGKKTEAAAIYKRIRDEFEISLVYLLNKDRIKDRSKFKPE